MNRNQLVARIGRRELRSSRAAASVLAASALITVLAWAGLEIVLAAFGLRALLASPRQVAGWVAGLAVHTVPAVLVAAGAVLALLGLVLILLGVLPGGRSRHLLPGDRAAVIVDDDVIAAALSRSAHQHAGLLPEQVTATVAARRIDLVIRPTSGVPVDEGGIRNVAQTELDRYNLTPAPRLSIRISSNGAVGA